MTPPGMLGDEGQRALDDQGPGLFPATTRPRFLLALWIALAVLAIAGGIVGAALAGKLS
jgi:hypothetical protein